MVAGSDNRQRVREVWRVEEEGRAFVQRLKHELQLAGICLEHSLLEIAHASVNQLCRLAGRAAAKILALDKDRLQAAAVKAGPQGSYECSAVGGWFRVRLLPKCPL